MPYSTSRGSENRTSSGFACPTKNLRARHAMRCVVGNWIPAARKSGRIRTRRFVSRCSLVKFDLLVESFDAFNERFLAFPLKILRSWWKLSLFTAPHRGTDTAPHNIVVRRILLLED